MLRQKRKRFELGDAKRGQRASAIMRDTEMRGPLTIAAMGAREIDFTVGIVRDARRARRAPAACR